MPDTLEKPQVLSVAEAIRTRRSIRAYTGEPIPEADLQEILRLTTLAPSAWNLQPWRLVVVTNRELIQGKLKDAGNNQRQYDTAPVAIAFTADGEDMLERAPQIARPGVDAQKFRANLDKAFGSKTTQERAEWARAQAFIGLGYLSIAARGLGYDTVLMGGFNESKVREVLDLPDHVRVVAMVTLGKRAEDGLDHHRLPLEHTIRFIR